MSRTWYQFLRDIWTVLGYDPDTIIYRDLFIDPLQCHNPDGNAAIAALATSGCYAVGLPNGSTSELAFVCRLPHDYNNDSDITPYVEWAPSNTNTGNAYLELKYAYSRNGSAVPSATKENIESAGPGTTEQVTRQAFTAISGDGVLQRGDLILGSVSRIGGDALDTFTGDMDVISIGFKIETRGVGWEEIHP
jgi:hypothetical protein